MSEVILSKDLYCQDSKGQIRQWTIDATSDAKLIFTHGLINGAKQFKVEQVILNKSGRTIDEQIILRMKSRISKMRDKGYVDTIEEAKQGRTSQLGYLKPMLAAKFNDFKKKINYSGAMVQRKYDGNRCLIANRAGQIIAYSRNGKPITSIGHILRGIKIPENTILDGELYAHGQTLQTIVSWVKREQKSTEKLMYHAYDLVSPLPFPERLATLSEIDLGPAGTLVETSPVASAEEAVEAFAEYREEGYEGAILRVGRAGYEDGKRSRSLLKIKEWHDDEFMVHSIVESRDGWAILVLRARNGLEFRVSAPGSIQERVNTLTYAEKYIGEFVTVEYAFLTKDGIPFHPIAKRWRFS